MFKPTLAMTDEEWQQVSEMCGKIMLGILRCDPDYKIAKDLNLDSWQLNHNVDEMLYDLKKRVGWKRYLKILFMK